MRVYMCIPMFLAFCPSIALSLSGVTLAKVQEWLKKQPVTGISTVDCGGQSLDEPQIAAVEKAVSNMKVCNLSDYIGELYETSVCCRSRRRRV